MLAAQALRPTPPDVGRVVALTMDIEGPGWSISYGNNHSENATVFLFLLEAARTLHFSVEWTNWSPPYSAVFIDGINGSRNGDGGSWWQFWVDGAYGSTAADLTILAGGETIAWRFVPPRG